MLLKILAHMRHKCGPPPSMAHWSCLQAHAYGHDDSSDPIPAQDCTDGRSKAQAQSIAEAAGLQLDTSTKATQNHTDVQIAIYPRWRASRWPRCRS